MRQSFTIRFLDQALAVDAPASIAGDIAAFFQLTSDGGDPGANIHSVVVSEVAPGRYALDYDGARLAADCPRGDLLHRLAALAGRELSFLRRGVALDAAAVGWEGKTILIVGPPGSGKSHLAAWLIDNGFSYVADSEVSLLDGTGALAGFAGPLAFPEHPISHIAAMPTFRNVASVLGGKQRLLIQPEPGWQASEPEQPCGLIVLANFTAGAALGIAPVPKSEAPLRLLDATRRVVIPGDPDHAPVARLADSAPLLRLTYGGFPQIEGVLDVLLRTTLAGDSTPAEFERFLAGLPQAAETPAKTYPVPAPTQRRLTPKPKLTIGMATYDDFDGVYFTLQALRLYHTDALQDVEFLVVDNHPDGPAGQPLKAFEEFVPTLRYIPVADTYGTAVKGRVFEEAGGEFVLYMDCHVLLLPGVLRRLRDYLEDHPQTRDLLQGPVVRDGLETLFTHYEPKWEGGFYGVWGHDPRGDDAEGQPFEIGMQNTGLFACRRDAWPGFNRHFRGYVPEEGYIHQKFRAAGGRTLCLPFFRCIHRMRRPVGVPYPMTWDDRIRNALIGLHELGLPSDDMEDHFQTLLGKATADRLFAAARQELWPAGPA